MLKITSIHSLTEEDLSLYSERGEKQLYHANEPSPGYFLAESSKIMLRALSDGYVPKSVLIEDRILKKYMCPHGALTPDVEMLNMIDALNETVEVYVLPHEQMIKTTGYNITGGVLGLMKRRPLSSAAELLGALPIRERARIVVLDDVENPINTGSIFRNSAAFGADAILLTNDCADPLYRRSARVSMGTVFQVPWTILQKDEDYIDLLNNIGFKTAALALTSKSVDIDDAALCKEQRLAIIMGNEGYGIPKERIQRSDYTVCIPMSNEVDSLNVAAASAVAIWQLCRK